MFNVQNKWHTRKKGQKRTQDAHTFLPFDSEIFNYLPSIQNLFPQFFYLQGTNRITSKKEDHVKKLNRWRKRSWTIIMNAISKRKCDECHALKTCKTPIIKIANIKELIVNFKKKGVMNVMHSINLDCTFRHDSIL